MASPEPDFEKRVSIIGFGLMGSQIAQVLARAQYQVLAYDVDNERLEGGLALIRTGKFGLEQAISKGKMDSATAKRILESIETTTSQSYALAGAEFVLEAAVENLPVKQGILKAAAKEASPKALLASNTSTLSIGKLGAGLSEDTRKRVVGMHFFNPPQVMKLVEVVRSQESSDSSVQKAVSIVRELHKVPVVVGDTPGFIANRIGILAFADASELLEKGVASVRDIDISMRLGYGYPMGPFELGDLVGLDARLRNMEVLYEQTGDSRFRPPELLKQLVASGYLGDPRLKKGSKGGYYEYFALKRPTDESTL